MCPSMQKKWTLFLTLCASRINSHLTFDFFQLPGRSCLKLLSIPCPLLLFASGMFIACGIGRNLCTKLKCVIEVHPFPAMRFSCILESKDSVRCPVDSRDSTLQSYIVLDFCFSLPIFGFRIRFHDACLSFTRHRGSHRSFQFSPRIFENFFISFVVWINKIDSSLSLSIVKLRFLFCPFLFFSILSGFSNFRAHFRPNMIWSVVA